MMLALAFGLGLTVSLTGAAVEPSPVASSEATETTACWHEYESRQEACAPTQDELKKVILQKYNKVLVENVEEFEAVKASKSYESMPVPDSVQASYDIGTLYTDANYGGNSDRYSTTNSMTCYGQTYTFWWGALPYNDQTSSFFGTGACQVRLYEDQNFYGSYYGYYDCRSNLANVGFNDRASSVSFHLTSFYSCF